MTGITSNIDQVIERFKGIGARTQAVDATEALTVGVNAARGQMTYRIFNKGLDANGGSLGIYTGKKHGLSKGKSETLFRKRKKDFLVGGGTNFSEYEIKRIKQGRQIRYKDLELSGTLRRGIVILTETNRVVCAIVNGQLYEIARFQEKQITQILGSEVKIFSLSKEERELLRENTIAALKQLYGRVINS